MIKFLYRHYLSLAALLVLGFFVWSPSLIHQIFSEVPSVFAQTASNSAQKATQDDDELSPEEEKEMDEKKKKVEELQRKLKEVEGQKVSLSSTIQLINTKISLQQAEIDKSQTELSLLERQVQELGTRINGLELSLDVLSEALVSRVNHSYKQLQTNPVELLILSDGMTDFFTKYRYNQIIQAHTREVMEKAEIQKVNFDQQKLVKAQKQTEVEKKKSQLQSLQNQMTSERAGQQQLLAETKNNEAKYQAELQKTLAELEAIQGIIAGQGNETKVREVGEGDQIATVIVGASPCSTGTHLHFEVVSGGSHRDPAAYLKSISPTWNNSPDGPFGFGGDWNWPLNDPARINQGFGMTYYARVRRAYGGAPHTGIDMVSKSGSTPVKAVKAGELYRGGIKCGGGTLKYVRVVHKDGLSTYYLHVNY